MFFPQVPGSNLGPLLQLFTNKSGALSGVMYNGPVGGYGGPSNPVGYTNAANMSLCVLDGMYQPPPGPVVNNGIWGNFTNITTDYAYQLSWQPTLKAMPGDPSGPYLPGVCNYPFNQDPFFTPTNVPTLMDQCIAEQRQVGLDTICSIP